VTGVTAPASAASALQIADFDAGRGRGERHVNSGDSRTKGRSYDPICGVAVESSDATPSSEYKKRRYFFCSQKCKHEFERAAERIRMQEAARAGALFTHGKVKWGLA
jgi:YHS domain-containing protein